ncbi:MAG: DsrE family protein [Gammaproteobacteria bacterium]|nr:DsrE family protein [Gammaproteobacteria bacterium]
MMKNTLFGLLLLFPFIVFAEGARYVETPYEVPRVVFDLYLDEPEGINSALHWMRSLINPVMEAPYEYSIDEMDIIVVIHGTEIVTVVKKNYEKYKTAVDRMRYYTEFGVQFKVCGLAAKDFDYTVEDFQDFIDVVPSAITELAYWQQKGYAVIKPTILSKKYRIDEIR